MIMNRLTLLGKLIIVFVFVILLGTALGLFVAVQTSLEKRVFSLEQKSASNSAVIVPVVEPTVEPTASPSAIPTVVLRKIIKAVTPIVQ